MNINIIESQEEHHEQVWDIFRSVVSTGDTYVYRPDISKTEALSLWCNQPERTFIALSDEKVLGTYIIKPNFPGFGSHIANLRFPLQNDRLIHSNVITQSTSK